jgi:hypothetical protein
MVLFMAEEDSVVMTGKVKGRETTMQKERKPKGKSVEILPKKRMMNAKEESRTWSRI